MRGIMATYCNCGDIATKFYDNDGNELQEPCCNECWYFQDIQMDNLLSSSETLPQNAQSLLARSMRLAVVQNQFDQGNLTEAEARELLSGPLIPGDETTIFNDADQLIVKSA